MKKTILNTWKCLLIALIISVMGVCVNACAAIMKGTYPTEKGMILVTSDWSCGLPTGHVAIVWDEGHVIEARTPGVVWGTNDWMSSCSEVYGIRVKGVTAEQAAAAADWCRQQIGKAYNYNYLDKRTREKFYCSQLVWAAFYDLYRIDLSDIGLGPLTWTTAVHPMELVNSDRTETVFYYKN